MDRAKLLELKNLLDELIGKDEPSDEELGFDDAAIDVYAEMHNLLEAINHFGI